MRAVLLALLPSACSSRLVGQQATQVLNAGSANDGRNLVQEPMGDAQQPLPRVSITHELARKNTDEHNASNLTSNKSFRKLAPPCTAAASVFDLGFYDGADSAIYLSAGYCVLGVEADPHLVEEAQDKFASWIAAGKLTMANVAVAPSDEKAWTTFYRNKCTREWNSFYETIGCRTCQPPHTIAASACDKVPIQVVTCAQILQYFGVPLYMKLDIEGAEPGCFAALQALGPAYHPRFLSSEITELSYLDSLHAAGYTQFKLTRQDLVHSSVSSRSGPWGNDALDCRTGTQWRTYEEARWEMHYILSKGFDADDPCTGGVCPIHDKNGCEKARVWYDVHVTRL